MRIYLTGARPAFDIHATRSLEERFNRTGRNVGNQVIAAGLLNRLRYDEVSWDVSLKAAQINEQFDHVVIAAANFLHSTFDFSYMADLLDAIRLPISIIGLGAQSKDFAADISLLPGTERLLSILGERCQLIGVRGDYTAGLLERRGIHNVQVTGCPSYYADFGHAWPAALPPLTSETRMAVNGSRDVVSHSFDREAMKLAVAKLMRLAFERSADFVAQTEREEMVLAEGYMEDMSPYLMPLRRMFAQGIDAAAFDDWAKDHCRVYWDVTKWIAAMCDKDFVIGTRFHGAIAGLLAGTPALVICHDTRTTEMSRFLGIPHTTLDRFNATPLERLYEEIDLDALGVRRAALMTSYRQFVSANALSFRD